MRLLVTRLGVVLALFQMSATTYLAAQSPNWPAPVSSAYQFSASVIASLELSDIPSNNGEDIIAFFKGDSIRGKGSAVMLGSGNYLHFISLYAHKALDTLTIRVYHKNTDQIYEVEEPFIFRSQSITGSIDQAYKVKVYPGNNTPISLLPIPLQSQLEGHAFDPIDLNAYLIQSYNTSEVEWTYVPNPSLMVNISGSVLNVEAVNGFTGQTELTIIATENNSVQENTRQLHRQSSAQLTNGQTNIVFEVVPLHPSPLWLPVLPGQGIVLGSQFDTIPLHDFENQYTGPEILYDYLPVIEENFPAEARPNWQVTQSFGTTMTIIARLDYTPRYQFHHDQDVLAAFSGNELRGIASRNASNGLFYLTVGGSQLMGDAIQLRLYSEALKKIITLDSAFIYQPYGISGTDQAPTIIEFAPIVPLIPDTPLSGGTYHMPVNILDESFVGSSSFTFFAMDPDFPQFLKDQTNATFCIVADSSGLSVFYRDMDGDGLGNPLDSIFNCLAPSGYVSNNDDCNDGEANFSSFTISVMENSGTPNDGIICPTSEVTLTVDQVAPSYLWNTGQTSQSIAVNPGLTTVYSVIIPEGMGCNGLVADTILVETKIVRNSANDGFNTLRNILACIVEDETITYDLPLTQNTLLTEDLTINKNVTINGSLNLRPRIFIDFNNAMIGISIDAGKKLILNNVDLESQGLPNQSPVGGSGTLEISGKTVISGP